MPHCTRRVVDGETIAMDGLAARIIHNPGHTLGAIRFVIDGCAFTGDTLFCAGCGRVFEGDPAMMQKSLDKLGSLPGDTKIYCGHEYTAANLKFAAAVEPENRDVVARAAALQTPSVPSTMGEERKTNPFLRARNAAVVAAAVQRGADQPGRGVRRDPRVEEQLLIAHHVQPKPFTKIHDPAPRPLVYSGSMRATKYFVLLALVGCGPVEPEWQRR